MLVSGLMQQGLSEEEARSHFFICDEHGLLLLFDSVQCGHFRSGRFQSYQRILEDADSPEAAAFMPDGVSMAKAAVISNALQQNLPGELRKRCEEEARSSSAPPPLKARRPKTRPV